MFEELLDQNEFTIEYVNNPSNREYNIAYILSCNNCGRKFVRSHKQLKAGNLHKCNCDCCVCNLYQRGSFNVEEYRDYAIITVTNCVNPYLDFIVVSLEDLETVFSLLEGRTTHSIRSLWQLNHYTSELFGGFIGIRFKNGVEFDFRRDNVVLSYDMDEEMLASYYMDKTRTYRGVYNYTFRNTNEDGRIIEQVGHFAYIYLIDDENGEKVRWYGLSKSHKYKKLDFRFDSDIQAIRQVYKLEEKYLLNNEHGYEVYNFMNDLSDSGRLTDFDSRFLYLPLMRGEIDDSFIRYQKLLALADTNPADIIRYGVEDEFKDYGIPCKCFMLVNPFSEKRESSVKRDFDVYICKYGREYDNQSKTFKGTQELVRCTVGRLKNCGTFDMYKPKGGHIEEMTFLNMLKEYGKKSCEYNDANGVKEEYTVKSIGEKKMKQLSEDKAAKKSMTTLSKSNKDMFNMIKNSL